jgi:hypothetical protein
VHHLLLDGTPLPNLPPAIEAIAARGDANLGDYLALDDAVLWVALDAWRNVSDPVLSDLTQRLLARRLFKTYELYGERSSAHESRIALDKAREVARTAGLDPDVYVGLDRAVDTPFDDTHEPLTVIFPNGSQRKPAEVSFLLARLRAERLERIRLIFAPELRADIVRSVEA